MDKLNEIIDTFASVDDEMRIELLLDYAGKLPPLPERYEKLREAGDARVPECMTPVHLWVERDAQGKLDIHAYVAPEAPTVAGLMGLVRESLQGQPLVDAMKLPADLAYQLKLDSLLRMNRAVGLGAMIARIKKQAKQLMDAADDSPQSPATAGKSHGGDA